MKDIKAKINYQIMLDKLIAGLECRPKLLLHACCAPCSSYCIEYLCRYFDVTIFYYNPNISSKQEFDKRYDEVKRLVREMSVDIDIVCPPYDSEEFLQAVKGYEDCKEGGDRCGICYAIRLKKTCEYAEQNNFDFYCSTLSISPHKDEQRLNQIGAALCKDKRVRHLPNDFKKKGGYLRSIELSKQYNLYRQNFCGCKFSQIKE